MKQNQAISSIRFPLIVLVVFVHLKGEVCPVTIGSNGSFWIFFTEMISHNLGAIAVPSFFVISGYLYFLGLDGDLTWTWTFGKWKKRVKSLLVPYLFWNLFVILAIIVKSNLFSLFGFAEDELMEYVRQMDVKDWLLTGPADFPLWYLRDLIVMVIISPLIYYLIKYFKLTTVILLAVPYFIWGTTSLFYFGAGAVMGLRKDDLAELSYRIRKPVYIIALIMLLASTAASGTAAHCTIRRCFIPFGVVAFYNLIAEMPVRVRNLFSRLSGSVFFIYAAHEIYILGWTRGMFLRVFGDGVTGSVISYFGIPVVVLTVCLVLYQVFRKVTPKTLSFVCGGR